MSFYHSLIFLNFGLDKFKKYLSKRAGTGRYRDTHTNYGRIRFWERGAADRESDHTIEIFVSTEFQWHMIQQHGLKNIFSFLTPGGNSKLIIFGHGNVESEVLSLHPKIITVRHRRKHPGIEKRERSFEISIQTLACLIAKNLPMNRFNSPQNFIGISLWSCKTAAVNLKSFSNVGDEKTAASLTMAGNLVLNLYKLGIFARVRGSMSVLRGYDPEQHKSDQKTNYPIQDDELLVNYSNLSPIPLTGYKAGHLLGYTSSLFGVIGDVNETIIPSQYQLISKPVMCLFMMDPRDIKVTVCHSKHGEPFIPSNFPYSGDQLLKLIYYKSDTMRIVLHALHVSNTISTLQNFQAVLADFYYRYDAILATDSVDNVLRIAKSCIDYLNQEGVIPAEKTITYEIELNKSFSLFGLPSFKLPGLSWPLNGVFGDMHSNQEPAPSPTSQMSRRSFSFSFDDNSSNLDNDAEFTSDEESYEEIESTYESGED